MLKIYNTNEEKIGYDFYIDIAMRIERKRNELDYKISELAKKSGIKISRMQNILYSKTRVKLKELKKLAEVLKVTVDYLIGADIDSDSGMCLYTVTFGEYFSKDVVNTNPRESFTVYQKSTSKQLAVLEMEDRGISQGFDVYRQNPRTRAFVKLVGIPVTDKDIAENFTAYDEDKDVLVPD